MGLVMLIPQRAFSSGELSPSLYARVDYFRYATGAKIIKNCYVKKSGGVDNRSGDEFIFNPVETASTSNVNLRMIPYVFSTTRTYNLVFGHLVMYVIKDGAVVFNSTKTVSISAGGGGVTVSYSGTDDYAAGDIVYVETTDQVGYPNSKNYHRRYFLVSSVNTGANTFVFTYLNGQAVIGLGSVGAITLKRVYKVTTPYVASDLASLKYAQSKGTLTLTHPTYAERELTTTADDAWSLSTISKVPTQVAPTSGAAAQQGVTGAAVYNYKLAAINDNTKEESLPTAAFGVTNGNATLDTTNYISITCTAASGATEYGVYKEIKPIWYLWFYWFFNFWLCF